MLRGRRRTDYLATPTCIFYLMVALPAMQETGPHLVGQSDEFL